MDKGVLGTRFFLFLGVVLLVGAAWYGGRMTAPSGASHGGMMHHHERSAGGPDTLFDGEEGTARCRTMMASMGDMHRSMRSVMGRDGSDQAASDSSDRRSGMGRGMMGGGMGHDGGSMGDQEGRHTGQMGHMGRMGESMNREEMRGLCRAMHATMQDVMHGSAPEEEGATADENGSPDLSLSSQTEQWLAQTRGFEQVEDHTGDSEVVIDVGAGEGLSYAPAAVRVDPGTTVRWRWTGKGGLHDVRFIHADVKAALRGERGETFTHTFANSGEYRYECTPHAAVGMRGVVIVEER